MPMAAPACNQRLALSRKAVDARGQYRLDAIGDLNAVHELAKPIAAPLAGQRLRLDESLHDLLEEERIAGGVADEAALERRQLALAA